MKNSLSILLLTFGVALSGGFSQAQDDAEKKKPQLSRLDKNGDKAISEEEAGPQIWERLGKLDKNGDGKIAGEEFRGMAGNRGEGQRPQPPKGGTNEFIKRLDKNSDGNITQDEAGQAWERLGTMDKDSDGTVSREEMIAGFRERMSAQRGQFFVRLDKNKDGKLVADEVTKGWDRIGKADKDNDGAVTKQEWDSAVASYMKTQGKPNQMGMTGGGAKRGGRTPGGPNPILGKYDEDKDGKLSKEEVPEDMWSKLSRADENADGLVSKSEMEAVYKKSRQYQEEMGNKANNKTDQKPKRPALE